METVRARQRPPSLLACLACRKKHLRCDGQPVCGRCQRKGVECLYTQSRRGYRGPKRSQTDHSSGTSAASSSAHSDSSRFSEGQSGFQDGASGDAPAPAPATVNGRYDHQASMPRPANVESGDLTTPESLPSSQSPSGHVRPPSLTTQHELLDPLVEAFYTSFYPAHPFVIPPVIYAQTGGHLPLYLVAVLKFIGSHYLPGVVPEAYESDARQVLHTAAVEDGFKVQALLLLALAMFARCQPDLALPCLESCVNLALTLGMNCKDFAAAYGQGNAIMEESWRRTWWDLYVVDGVVSIMDQIGWSSRLRDVSSDVPFPGECREYLQCRPSLETRSRYEMENRAFVGVDAPWSSYAYEIEATRILHTVARMTATHHQGQYLDIEALDASISGYQYSLPESKRGLVIRDGKLDEVLFASKAIVQLASITLHRPRSSLCLVPASLDTVCSRSGPILTPAQPLLNHTSKALQAANEISRMTSLRVPVTVHTPCFVCAVAKAATVHIPAFMIELDPQAAGTTKERLQLAINALSTMGDVWPIGKAVKMQISQYAREALASAKEYGSFGRVGEDGGFPGPLSSPTVEDAWLQALDYYIPNAVM